MKQNQSAYSPFVYFKVAMAVIIMVVLWGVYFSFGIYFKPMLAEFGWTRAMVSGGFSLASLMSGLLSAYLGWMNDKVGSRKVMTLCGIALGTGCLLLSRIGSLWQFYLFYGIIIGFAMGGGFIPLISSITRWFETDRGLMNGIVASGVGIGALVGPQVSNQLLLAFGWRNAYFFTGIAALVIVILAAQFLKSPNSRNPATGDHDRQNQQTPLQEITGVSLKSALRSIQFWIFAVTGFCYGYNLFSLTVHVVPYAIDLGVDTNLAAGLLSTYGGLSIGGKILFGKILDKINGRRTMAIGFFVMAISFAILTNAQQTAILFLSVGLFGFFYGSATVSHSPLTAVLFGLKSHGLLLGIFGLSVTVGGAVGPFLTGAVIDRFHSGKIAFGICVGISLLGLAATLSIKHRNIQAL